MELVSGGPSRLVLARVELQYQGTTGTYLPSCYSCYRRTPYQNTHVVTHTPDRIQRADPLCERDE